MKRDWWRLGWAVYMTPGRVDPGNVGVAHAWLDCGVGWQCWGRLLDWRRMDIQGELWRSGSVWEQPEVAR